MVVWGGFTNSWGKKRSEGQRTKGNIYSTECRVPENSKKRFKKKAFLNEQCREIEGANRREMIRDLFKKMRYWEKISCKDRDNNGQKH